MERQSSFTTTEEGLLASHVSTVALRMTRHRYCVGALITHSHSHAIAVAVSVQSDYGGLIVCLLAKVVFSLKRIVVNDGRKSNWLRLEYFNGIGTFFLMSE